MYDGLQRPFEAMSEGGRKIFLPRGSNVPALNKSQLWEYEPQHFKIGDRISGGDIFGKVYENELVSHWIMVPPKQVGRIVYIAPGGHYTVQEEILVIENNGVQQIITMMHQWHVRQPRPIGEKVCSTCPLYTGLRVLDSLFPGLMGLKYTIAGASGTGKGVICQSIAKHSNADVVVYIACCERGNELADMRCSFQEQTTNVKGVEGSIMKRTCIVANASNMPLASREASIYTGITTAEYFRDQGYNVVAVADSLDRWVEAMVVPGKHVDMPCSSGYPAFMSSRINNFVERAGKISCHGSPTRSGSITLLATTSPPGGDFSDSVTSCLFSCTQAYWALDRKKAQRRHYPSVSFVNSYSANTRYHLQTFYDCLDSEYITLQTKMKEILQMEFDLEEIVQLVGWSSLAESDKLYLEVAKLIHQDFLYQDVNTKYDRECPFYKTLWMMRNIITFHTLAQKAVESDGKTRAYHVLSSTSEIVHKLGKMKYEDPADGERVVVANMKKINDEILQAFGYNQ